MPLSIFSSIAGAVAGNKNIETGFCPKRGKPKES